MGCSEVRQFILPVNTHGCQVGHGTDHGLHWGSRARRPAGLCCGLWHTRQRAAKQECYLVGQTHLTRLLDTGRGSEASPSIWYVHRWPRSLMMSSQTARLTAARTHKLPMIHPGSTEGTRCCAGHVTHVSQSGVGSSCRRSAEAYLWLVCPFLRRRVPCSQERSRHMFLSQWGTERDGAPGRTAESSDRRGSLRRSSSPQRSRASCRTAG